MALGRSVLQAVKSQIVTPFAVFHRSILPPVPAVIISVVVSRQGGFREGAI
jgi:hypothetical protein